MPDLKAKESEGTERRKRKEKKRKGIDYYWGCKEGRVEASRESKLAWALELTL